MAHGMGGILLPLLGSISLKKEGQKARHELRLAFLSPVIPLLLNTLLWSDQERRKGQTANGHC